MKEYFPIGVERPFKCVLTDFSGHFVDFWRNHPPLMKLAQDGWLDYAVFDTENDTQIELEVGHTILNASTLHNPIVVVANYLFDSLKQAAMRFQRDHVEVVNCEVISDRPYILNIISEVDSSNPDIINHMNCEWLYEDSDLDYFNDDILKEVLKGYTEFENSTILIPIGSIATMKNINELSGGKYLMLVGDKAYLTLQELSNLGSPFISIHGSFSFVVNLHCLMEYLKKNNNTCLCTPYTDGIKCCAFYKGVDKHIMNQFNYFWKV